MKNIATIALIAASAAFAGCASPQSTATTKESNADTKAVALGNSLGIGVAFLGCGSALR